MIQLSLDSLPTTSGIIKDKTFVSTLRNILRNRVNKKFASVQIYMVASDFEFISKKMLQYEAIDPQVEKSAGKK